MSFLLCCLTLAPTNAIFALTTAGAIGARLTGDRSLARRCRPPHF
jgi:hypothetical protein